LRKVEGVSMCVTGIGLEKARARKASGSLCLNGPALLWGGGGVVPFSRAKGMISNA
jgi:hypothetical protein